MADVPASLVKPAMTELGRLVVVKIKHLFTYLCCFDNNIQGLMNEAQKLEDARAGLQNRVEVDENNAQVILPEVWTWLQNASNKIQVDMKRIHDEISNVKNGYWSVKSRYRLSRIAVKITGEMKQLIEDCSKFNNHISTPPLPTTQEGYSYDFHSRKKIEEKIMEALRSKEVTTVGICGMGGVGKTTMARRITDTVNKENIFQEIFMIVVGQQADMLKIQDEIGESLGLTLGEKTLSARANTIRARLMSTKRILIVFDDIWEKLKLKDLGIPCGNECCTILLMSRNKDVLEKMDAQKICGVTVLAETEAWFLFREKTGPCVDDPNLLSTAESIARECKGLPIALITVGVALKDVTSILIWQDALVQLQNANLEDILDVIKEVYNPLKLSYTYLESRRAKWLFLLCSLFPENEDISLEELTSYCIGLRIFPDFDFSNASGGILEKARRRVFTIIDMLKNRFLLLNGRDENHVRMHDVVRDVGIYVASGEANEGIVDVKFNSMHSTSEYTYQGVSVFSEKPSSFLRMHGRNRKFEIKDISIFEEIEQLRVLSFQSIIMKSIPLEIQLLKNLQTLRLVSCRLESLSVVGEFLCLEILCCRDCSGIEELPVEIGKLNQLKLLDFTHCRSLKRIPPGVISNLVELEEFQMLHSFSGWELAGAAEVQEQERRNTCLNEFENLSKLTCLKIEIKDLNLATEEIRFSPNMVKHHIRMGDIDYIHVEDTSHAKGMCVRLSKEVNLGSWVLKFLSGADRLRLEGDGLKSLDLLLAHVKKSLIFENCSTVKEVVNSATTSIADLSEFDVFPILEHLQLSGLPNLEEIYDGPVSDQSNSFKNLENLELYDLPALKHLWKQGPNNNIVSLDKLRHIRIKRCNNLRNLFSLTTCTETDQIDYLLCTQKVHFPILEDLELDGLGKLEVIWNAPIIAPIIEGSNSFRNLTTLILSNLSAMTQLWNTPSMDVSLSGLSRIFIDGCHKLHSLFSCTMSMNILSQLAELDIRNCEMIEQVLLNDGNQCHAIQFSKLSKLKLDSLESFTTFSNGIESIEFLMLEDMVIKNCPKLMGLVSSNKNNQNSADNHKDNTFDLFCSQKVFFPMLERMELEGLDKLEVIWNYPIPEGSHSFKNLREITLRNLPTMTHLWKNSKLSVSLGSLSQIHINGCPKLHILFLSTMTMEFLSQLAELDITNCEMMEQLLLIEETEHDGNHCHTIKFPKLSKLKIYSLESLSAFTNGIESIEFPMLEHINTTKLVSLLSSNLNNQELAEGHDEDTFHLICSKKISFGSLKRVSIIGEGKRNIWCRQIPPRFFRQLEVLQIENCKHIRSLFSSSIAIELVNLELLKIWKCDEMVEVIEEIPCEKPRILFPSLKELDFGYLPKLESLCNCRCDFQLPLLEYATIIECPLLEPFGI